MSSLANFAGFTFICESGQKTETYLAKLSFWVALALFVGSCFFIARHNKLHQWAKILLIIGIFAILAIMYAFTMFWLIGGVFTGCDPNPFSLHWDNSAY